MRWFEEERQRWIGEMIHIYGFVNREHVMRKFGVSTPQASKDINRFLKNNVNTLTYNLHTKRYELTKAIADE